MMDKAKAADRLYTQAELDAAVAAEHTDTSIALLESKDAEIAAAVKAALAASAAPKPHVVFTDKGLSAQEIADRHSGALNTKNKRPQGATIVTATVTGIMAGPLTSAGIGDIALSLQPDRSIMVYMPGSPYAKAIVPAPRFVYDPETGENIVAPNDGGTLAIRRLERAIAERWATANAEAKALNVSVFGRPWSLDMGAQSVPGVAGSATA